MELPEPSRVGRGRGGSESWREGASGEGREKSRQKENPGFQIQYFNSSATKRILISSITCWVAGESLLENKRSYEF